MKIKKSPPPYYLDEYVFSFVQDELSKFKHGLNSTPKERFKFYDLCRTYQDRFGTKVPEEILPLIWKESQNVS